MSNPMDAYTKLFSKKILLCSNDLDELKARMLHLENENEYLLSRNEALDLEVHQFIRSVGDHNQNFKDYLTCASQNALLLKHIAQLEKRISDLQIKMETDSSEFKLKLEASALELSRSQNQVDLLKSASQCSLKQLISEAKEVNDSRLQTVSSNVESQLDAIRNNLSSQQALTAAKKEVASLHQSYGIRIHNLRMKHEEQLLKATLD